jgi:hypothetical protein
MAQLIAPGSTGSVGAVDTSQGEFREQIDSIAGLVIQTLGSGDAISGLSSDRLLTSRYALYVNPTIGSDRYVAGVANAATTPPLLNQQQVCGYSQFAPFRTIQRALLEVARLSVIAGADNDESDRFVIHVSAGTHEIENGLPSGSVAPWASDFTPSASDLRLFNDPSGMGVILPRGVSVIGESLRETVIRPADVPTASASPATGRGAIFKATGGAFFFNFTFKDQVGRTTSHHLLSAFGFAGSSEMTDYYSKIETAFGLAGAEVRPGETEISVPYPDGTAQSDTDTTANSSAYVFNCSLRSDYGMCGIYMDGAKVTGLKSMVTAQFTNVSLQRDMQAWQIWSSGSGTWSVPSDYDAYIASDINNVRARIGGAWDPVTDTYATDYRSFGFKCVNDAIIQEVSCFVIGDAAHHWTGSGGECTITNSNSNFGLTSLLSSGFKGVGTAGGAFPQDRGFLCSSVVRPLRIKQNGSNIRQINLGVVADYDDTTGELTLAAAVDVPGLLQRNGYDLNAGDYIWVENRSRLTGPGYVPGDPDASTPLDARAQLAGSAWGDGTPEVINVTVSGDPAVNNIGTISGAEIVGNRVYVRRLVDSRTPSEREYSLIVENSNTSNTRRPVGNYVLRLSGKSVVGEQLDPTNGKDEIYLVDDATPIAGSTSSWRLMLRPGDSAEGFVPDSYYRPGQAIFANGRVKRSKISGVQTGFDSDNWENSLPMLPSVRGVERGRAAVAPSIVIDKDRSNDPASTTLGVDLDTDPEVLAQLRGSTDFEAIGKLMLVLGYANSDLGVSGGTMAGKILAPQASSSARAWLVNAAASPTPSGKITSKSPWPIEFNRPSLIRAFGQAYEWAGQGNYSKALPKYQVSVLTDQHKIDFFGVGYLGGRVYNTGFNEDGLLVQGDTIRDLSTGRVVSTEVAGLGGLSGDPTFEDFPTSFDTLEVTTQLTVPGASLLNNVTLSGLIDGGPDWSPGVLPVAAPTVSGIIGLASRADALAFTDTDKAITADTLGYVRGRADGIASLGPDGLLLDAEIPVIPGAKLPVIPVANLPVIPLEKWPIEPQVWVSGADNIAATSNFTFEYTGDSGLLALGAPVIQSTYVGSSGFIVVTNATTTLVTGINSAQWQATQNAWIDPQNSLVGLAGKLLLSFYVESQANIIYNVVRIV